MIVYHNTLFIRYYLKGEKQGKSEIFTNLPGFPDNIRITDHKTLLVALVVTRATDITRRSILDLLGEYPKIRTIVGTVCNFQFSGYHMFSLFLVFLIDI